MDMLSRFHPRRRVLAGSIAALFVSALAAPLAPAANYFWDGGTADIATNGDGASQGGDGTWNKAIKNWDVGASAHVIWPDGNTAVFGGTGGTVTLGAANSAIGLSFTSGGYNIAANGANTLSITGSTLALTTTTGTTTLSGPVITNQGNTNQTWSLATGSTLNLTGTLAQGATVGGTTTNLVFTSPVITGSGGTVNYSGTSFTPYKFTLAGGVTMNSTGTASIPATGTYTGIGDGTSGTLNVTAGSFTTAATLFLGNTTTANAVDTGTLNITGGTVTTKSIALGNGYAQNGNGVGVLTLSGGGVLNTTSTAGSIILGNTGSGSGTLNLDGGILQTNSLLTQGSFATTTAGFTKASVVNLNGTAIQALGTTFGIAATVTANVRDGGAKIDTNSFNVTVPANLVHSPLGGDATMDGGLVKSGLGTLTLSSSANTYTGATNITAGTLTLTGTTALATGVLAGTPSITVGTGAALTLTSGGNDVLGTTAGISALIINGGTVSNNGSAKRVTLANTVTMVGGILGGSSAGDASGVYAWNVSNGGLNATSASNAAAATVNVKTSLQANTVFNVTRGAAVSGLSPDLTVSGTIADYSGVTGKSLSKTGDGLLLLSGANTYTGITNITAGTVRLGNATALGTSTSGTTVSGTGQLDLNALNLGAEAVTVSGSGPDGSGAIISSNVAQQTNALRFLTLAGDTSLGGTGRWDLRVSGTATLDMGGRTLTKVGPNFIGIVGLTSTVANPGNIIVNGGTLDLESNTNLGGSTANTLTVNSGTTLQVYSQTLANVWTMKLNDATFYASNGNTGWAGPVQITGTDTLNIISGAVATFTGGVTGTGGLLKTNSGVLTLAGTNTYTGVTNVQGGTLRANGANNLAPRSDVTLASGTVLDLQNSSNTIGALAGGGSVTLGAGTLTIGGPAANPVNTSGVFTSPISGAGGIVKNGSGSQTLSGLNSYTGPTIVNGGALILGGSSSTAYTGNVTINGGLLQIGDGTGSPSINTSDILDNGTLAFQRSAASTASQALPNRVYGTGGLTQNGDDTLGLGFDNEFTGAVTITNGVISVGKLAAGATAQPLGKGNSIVLGGGTTVGTLQYYGTAAVLDKNITVMGAGGALNNYGNALWTIAGAVNSAGHTLYLQPADQGANIAVTGVISGTGAGTAVVVDTIQFGSGTATLSNANTYAGPTYIRNGGELSAGVANALPVANGRTAVNFDMGNGTLTLHADQAIASLTSTVAAGTTAVNLNSSALTVGGAAGTTAFAGSFIGDGGVTKDGAGTQVLSGALSYTGPTKVQSGTLELSGSVVGTSALSIGAGQLRLSASQVFNSATPVSLSEGATLALSGLGNKEKLGALDTSGTVTLDLGTANGSTLTFDSLTSFSGTLNVLNWTGGIYGSSSTDGGDLSQDRLLFTAFATLSPAQLANIHFFNDSGAALGPAREIAYAGGGELVPVPEPASAAISLVGVGLLGFRRGGRRRVVC